MKSEVFNMDCMEAMREMPDADDIEFHGRSFTRRLCSSCGEDLGFSECDPCLHCQMIDGYTQSDD